MRPVTRRIAFLGLSLGALVAVAAAGWGYLAHRASARAAAKSCVEEMLALAKPAEAEECLRKLKALGGDEAPSLEAQLRLSQGQHSKALAGFKQATEGNVGTARDWTQRGFLEWVTGQRAVGKKSLERAIALDPESSEAWAYLSQVYALEGSLSQARVAVENAGRGKAPKDSGALSLQVAELMRRQGKGSDADTFLRSFSTGGQTK